MIVLDSDLLISFLNAHGPVVKAVEAFEASGEELATTSLNVAEVLRGCGPERSRQRILAEGFLAGLTEIPFGPRAARRFSLFMQAADRQGVSLPVRDAMVAAAVLEAGGRLATRNEGDFARIPGLEIVTV